VGGVPPAAQHGIAAIGDIREGVEQRAVQIEKHRLEIHFDLSSENGRPMVGRPAWGCLAVLVPNLILTGDGPPAIIPFFGAKPIANLPPQGPFGVGIGKRP
jgi:hypothetical protein